MSDVSSFFFRYENKWQFREPRIFQMCPDSCIACATSVKKDTCFIKNYIYSVECNICQSIYIGQTSRCCRNRIIEHLEKVDTHVKLHMDQHSSCSKFDFKRRIIAVERDYNKRTALEALYISKFSKSHILMNGCIGRELHNCIE